MTFKLKLFGQYYRLRGTSDRMSVVSCVLTLKVIVDTTKFPITTTSGYKVLGLVVLAYEVYHHLAAF